MHIKIADFGSPLQLASVELRRRVLRLPLGLDFSKEELEGERHQAHFVAVDASGTVVGVLLMVPLPNGSVKMRQVAVDSTQQGTGIGRQLVKASEDWSKEQGFSSIVLNARSTAVQFYLSLGYATASEEFIEVGIPHYTMEKAIN